jgi:hypothetical protein
LDASKEWGFGVMVYHVKGEPKDNEVRFAKGSIEPILFLSQQLTTAERNYWPTELEMAGMI